MNINLWSLLSNCREAEDEKKQRAEIERRRKEEEALVAKYLEAERIKADEVSWTHLAFGKRSLGLNQRLY